MISTTNLSPTHAARQKVWQSSIQNIRNSALPGEAEITDNNTIMLDSLRSESTALDDLNSPVVSIASMVSQATKGNREAEAVLGEIKQNLTKQFGAHDFQVSKSVSQSPEGAFLMGTAWKDGATTGGVNIIVHETPSVPGGLLYMEPMQPDQVDSVLSGEMIALFPDEAIEKNRAAVRGIIIQLGSKLPSTVKDAMNETIPQADWTLTAAGQMPNGDLVLVSMSEAENHKPYESKVFVASEGGLSKFDIPEGAYERWGSDADIITSDDLTLYIPSSEARNREAPQRGPDTQGRAWHRQLGRILNYDIETTPMSVMKNMWMNGLSAETMMDSSEIQRAAV